MGICPSWTAHSKISSATARREQSKCPQFRPVPPEAHWMSGIAVSPSTPWSWHSSSARWRLDQQTSISGSNWRASRPWWQTWTVSFIWQPDMYIQLEAMSKSWMWWILPVGGFSTIPSYKVTSCQSSLPLSICATERRDMLLPRLSRQRPDKLNSANKSEPKNYCFG